MQKKINFQYRDFNITKYCRNLYERYGEDYGYSDKLNFAKMSINELRGFVTVFNQLDYENSIARQAYRTLSNGEEFAYNYAKKKVIQDKLNKEFDRRYSDDIVMLYKFLDKEIIKNEKWTGERRYAIWDYNVSMDSPEFRSFLLAYRLYQKAKNIGAKVSDILDIVQMMHSCFSHYLTFRNMDEKEIKKRVMLAHQAVENPEETYEEILKFNF